MCQTGGGIPPQSRIQGNERNGQGWMMKRDRRWNGPFQKPVSNQMGGQVLYKRSSKSSAYWCQTSSIRFLMSWQELWSEECDRRGYRLTLCNSNDDLEKEKRNLSLLERMNADGVILMTNMDERSIRKWGNCRIPVVMIDRQIEGREIACIQSNHYQGGRMSVEHLLECGCRHIVQMSGPLHLPVPESATRGTWMCRERGIGPARIEGRLQLGVGNRDGGAAAGAVPGYGRNHSGQRHGGHIGL